MHTSIVTFAFNVAAFSLGINALVTDDIPIFSFPKVRFGDLLMSDKSSSLLVVHTLTTLGGIEIFDIPNFGEARADGLENLAKCLTDDSKSPMMMMSDGSRRLTTAGSANEKMSGECGVVASRLRSIVDGAVTQLLRVLDISSTENVKKPLQSPAYSYEEIGRSGKHLEHMHAYFPPKYSDYGEVDNTVATMDMHTDSGLFIAMTTGFYSSTDTSSKFTPPPNGLYIQLPSGQIAQVDSSDDSLIIMVGSGGADWLLPALGAPLRALPHALKIPTTLSTSTETWTRAWYGKMYLPPNDAVIASTEKTGDITYETYRQKEIEAVAAASIRDTDPVSSKLLPSACGSHKMDMSKMMEGTKVVPMTSSLRSSPISNAYTHMVKNTLCGADNAGVMCWTQCQDPSNLPCGTSAQCVDTVTGEIVDGNDHCPESDMSLCELQCVEDISDGGNSTDSNSDFCYGSGVTMYMDGFYSTLQEEKGDTACVNLFFTEWTLDNGTKYALGCMGIFLVGMFVEFLTFCRKKIVKSFPWSIGRDVVMVVLHGTQVFFGYLLMLAAMTYNVELFVMVLLGVMAGYACFNLAAPPKANLDPCCANGDEDDVYTAMVGTTKN